MAELVEGDYKVNIDKDWDLEDLYKFPRAYEQVYFMLYSIYPHEDEYTQEAIRHAYASYPWRGGYSAVNFYNRLKYTIPKKRRPNIVSIQYASPGWIELGVILTIAFTISRLVKTVCKSIDMANATYTGIYRGLTDRKLMDIEVARAELELSKEQREFIRQSNFEMAGILQIPDVHSINAKTGSELRTLKIFLSLFRRIKVLSEYQRRGKADL